MVNGSFVFGLDADRPDVFDRTVDWAVSRSLETATFHIMTPYPGTALHTRMSQENRITEIDWDLYDTRHVVYQPRGMTPAQLEAGYWKAYRDFYRWPAIIPRSTPTRNHATPTPPLRRRLEKIRTTLGQSHQGQTRSHHAPPPRTNTRRIRTRSPPPHRPAPTRHSRARPRRRLTQLARSLPRTRISFDAIPALERCSATRITCLQYRQGLRP